MIQPKNSSSIYSNRVESGTTLAKPFADRNRTFKKLETLAFFRLKAPNLTIQERKNAIGELKMFYSGTGDKTSFENTGKNFQNAIDRLFPVSDEGAAIFNIFLKSKTPTFWTAKKAEKFSHLLALCYFRLSLIHI